MRKKQVSFLMAVIMFLSLFGNTSSTVYGATTYLVNADFEGDTDGFAVKGSGNIEISQKAGKDGLRVYNRTDNWNGAEIDVLSGIAATEYTSSMWVYQESGSEQMVLLSLNTIANGVEAWSTLASASIPSGVWTQVTGSYTLSATGTFTKASVYVEAELGSLEFYVDDIQVAYDDSTVTPTEGNNGASFVGVTSSFESGLDGLTPNVGSEVLTLSTNNPRTGAQCIAVTNRLNSYEGIKYEYSADAVSGTTYEYSFWVRQDSGSPKDFSMTIHKNVSSDTYENIATAVVPSGIWTEIKGSYALSYTGVLGHLSVYLESPDATLDFFVDDVEVKAAVEGTKSIQEDLPSMAEAYKNYFKIGVAIPESSLGSAIETSLITKHFNSITAENAMKPGFVLDKVNRGEIDPSNLDLYYNYAKDNGLVLRGHTLLWHLETPDWFFKENFSDTGALVTREVMLERMDNYIGSVIDRYEDGVIYAWDVVNEAIDTSEPDNIRNSYWKQTIGPDYVIEAFKSAKKHIGDKNIKLFYNDYDFNQAAKRAAIYELVTQLNDLGLIDGVGMQTHISMDSPNVSEMQRTITLFANLGLDIEITELDVNVYRSELQSYVTVPEEVLVKQGYRYKALFELFKANSDAITNVTFWGLTDNKSWLNYFFTPQRNNWPLVFDANYQAKPAYYGIMDPSQLPVDNQLINAFNGSVVIDGIEDLNFKMQQEVELRVDDAQAASIKTLWDGDYLYLYGKINDSNKDASDYLQIMIDQDRSRSEALEDLDLVFKVDRAGAITSQNGSTQGIVSRVVDKDDYYIVELAIPLGNDVLVRGDSIGFDFAINNTSYSKWNDLLDNNTISPSRFGTIAFKDELKSLVANKGTAIIDGELDGIWQDANVTNVNTYTQNTTGATAKVKVLWDNGFVYLYADVTDSNLSKSNINPWEQDSFEIFMDENYKRTSSYESDDVQYRINYANGVSISGGPNPSTFASATKVTPTGYVVEAKIPFNIGTPTLGAVLGLDFQVNDDQGTGSRNAMTNWNNLDGDGWKNTENFGVLILGEEKTTTPTPTTPTSTQTTTTTTPADKVDVKSQKVDNKEVVEVKLGLEKNDKVDVSVKLKGDALGNINAVLNASLFMKQEIGQIKNVVLDSPIGQISIPSEALKKVIEGAKKVELSAKKADISLLSEANKVLFKDKLVLDLSLKVDDQSISKFDKAIEIKVPYTLGLNEKANSIVVYYINDDGQLKVVTNGHYNEATKTVTFKVKHFSQYAVGYNKVDFLDVKGEEWFASDAELLASKGIIQGNGAEEFLPSQLVTRAEFIKMLTYASELLDETAKSDFIDVQSNKWYYAAIASAQTSGIIKGNEKGEFMGNQPISKEDMATMMYRTLESLEVEKETVSVSTLKDLAEVANYAQTSVQYLNSVEIIEGDGDKAFKPKAFSTRAEAVAMISRFLAHLNQ